MSFNNSPVYDPFPAIILERLFSMTKVRIKFICKWDEILNSVYVYQSVSFLSSDKWA